jgi:hypothetical protein
MDQGVVAPAGDLDEEGRSMLIEWATITVVTVVVVLLVDWAIRGREGEGGEIDPPGQVPAGPVVVAPRAEGQGEAAA